MKKWEYKVLRVAADHAGFEDKLNVLGKLDWELVVSGLPTTSFSSNPVTILVFKREIPEPPTDKQIDQLATSLDNDCKKREIPE